MKPVDYRNETFEQVKERMEAVRADVWRGMMRHGGHNTTREWAELLEMDLLTVRPRITELCQMGFAKVNGGGREGLYRACSEFEAMQHHHEAAKLARNPQLELAL